MSERAWAEGYQAGIEDTIARYDESARDGVPTPGDSIYRHPDRPNPYAGTGEGHYLSGDASGYRCTCGESFPGPGPALGHIAREALPETTAWANDFEHEGDR